MKRIEKARAAFESKDIEATKKAHSAEALKSAAEHHKVTGSYVGDFVYGAIDGSVTTFAVVSGVVGAALSVNIVIILGLANLFADGFSISVYISIAETFSFADNSFVISDEK